MPASVRLFNRKDRREAEYLATHYRDDQINCMLMAMGMPFSYAQPYVVDSTQTMPPEIFIGRKTELQNIKDIARYTGNEGDSWVYNLSGEGINGPSGYSRNGNIGIDNSIYRDGIEVWLARWNGKPEKSWVYAEYQIGGVFDTLSGRIGLIESPNIENFDITVYFYGDDELLNKYEITPSNCDVAISVDVTNIHVLRVHVKDNIAVAGGTSLALHGLRLKTEKDSNDEHIDASPFSQQYWIIFTEGFRDDQIEASTADSELSRDELYIIWNRSLELIDNTYTGGCNQYELISDAYEWEMIGNYKRLTDYATSIIASNLDVYDSNGNLVLQAVSYDELDWDTVDHYR